MTRLQTDAWLLRGISGIPGQLVLRGRFLTFVSRGMGSAWPWQFAKLERLHDVSGYLKAAMEGSAFQLFNWPVSEVAVSVPWYYFGGGIKLARNGLHLRFSFGAPAGNRSNLASAVANLQQARAMRSRGKLWAAAVAEAARNSGDA